MRSRVVRTGTVIRRMRSGWVGTEKRADGDASGMNGANDGRSRRGNRVKNERGKVRA
jgi:hypothetical protein